MKLVFGAALAFSLAACSAAPSKPAESGAQLKAQPPAATTQSSAAAKKVQVDGEDIPGFMMAMTMSYPVKDEHQLDGLAPGDTITATVMSAKDDYWLEDIAKAK